MAERRTTLVGDAMVPAEESGAHPYRRFVEAHGFVLSNTEIARHLDLPVADDLLASLSEAARPHHEGFYRLETHVGCVPRRLQESLCAVMNQLGVDAPTGDIEFEAESLTPARYRAYADLELRQRRTRLTTVAVEEVSDDVVAYTDLVLPAGAPTVAWQWGTLVHKSHRGHRLGTAVKVENLRRLQGEDPGRERVVTCNDDTNRWMVDINERLGFRVVELCPAYQRKLADPTGPPNAENAQSRHNPPRDHDGPERPIREGEERRVLLDGDSPPRQSSCSSLDLWLQALDDFLQHPPRAGSSRSYRRAGGGLGDPGWMSQDQVGHYASSTPSLPQGCRRRAASRQADPHTSVAFSVLPDAGPPGSVGHSVDLTAPLAAEVASDLAATCIHHRQGGRWWPSCPSGRQLPATPTTRGRRCGRCGAVPLLEAEPGADLEGIFGGADQVASRESRRLVALGGIAVEREAEAVPSAQVAEPAQVQGRGPETGQRLLSALAPGRRRPFLRQRTGVAVEVDVAELAPEPHVEVAVEAGKAPLGVGTKTSLYLTADRRGDGSPATVGVVDPASGRLGRAHAGGGDAEAGSDGTRPRRRASSWSGSGRVRTSTISSSSSTNQA